MSSSPYPLTSPWTWAVPLLALLAALGVWLTNSNEPLFRLLNGLGPRSRDGLWAQLTLLGDTLVAFSLLGLFARRRPDIVWALLLAALFTTLWVHGLKPLLHLPRPLAALGAEQVHVIGIPLLRGSFPSGHTATAFTLVGVICLQRVPPALAVVSLLLAILVGVSRVVVGAHWPLDILGGAFGGWLGAVIGVALARRWPAPRAWAYRFGSGLVLLGCSLSLLMLHDSGYPVALWLQRGIALLTTVVLLFHLSVLLRQRSTG
jgi:membrane-associated phospholipid phosphatase